MYSQGGNKVARYFTALGSARETLSCLEVAQALYGMQIPAPVNQRLSQVIGTLARLTS